MRARGPLLALFAAVAIIVVVALASRSDRAGGPPLDPDSTEPDGTRALTELIDAFGPPVERVVGLGDERFGAGDVLLVLEGGLDDESLERLDEAAVAGARVVVAVGDGRVARAPVVEVLQPGATADAGPCPLGWDELAVVRGFTVRFAPGAGDLGCFGDDRAVAVLRRPVGRGERIEIGGPWPFTNQYLAGEDNAALATRLFAGNRTVHLVRPAPFSTGDQTLVDLLPDGFWRLVVQLAVAFGLFVWASAVRLGRPVREPTLWELPATAFTESVAQLYQRGGRRHLAARWLRWRARRDLLHRFQLPPDTEIEQLATVAAAAAGRPEDAGRYAAVLRDGEPTTTEELLQVATDVDRLRQEVSHGSS